jgi:alanyl-tRNA synthetase
LLTSERLYYADSFLRTFSGTVTNVREVTRNNGERTSKVSLNRTAFYPTSGGQPFDTGQLRAKLPDGTTLKIPVEQVEEDEEGEVWHFTREPIITGTLAEGHIDWERRFDHMQQHTGQHLLSATFWRELQARTISFHLGEDTSTIDLAGGPLAIQSLERVERIANEMIGEDRPVTMRYVSRGEAEAMLAAGELRKLPDRQGEIRLINIADYDQNACGGTHIRSTGQIGGLLVRSVEKISRGVRIEFVCGLRAVRSARADFASVREISALLSTGPGELGSTVGRLLTVGKENEKERQKLREELADLQASRLAMEVPIQNGLRLVVRGWSDRDRDFVKLLASRTPRGAQRTAVIFCANEASTVRMFLGRSSDLDFNCGRILKEALAHFGLRGGGSADLAQGDIPAEQQAALEVLVRNAILKAMAEAHNQQ